MKRWMLTEPAFIGGALLATGSRITENDLPSGPEYKEPKLDLAGNPIANQPLIKTGKTIKSGPPQSAIEIDKNGQPVNDDDLATFGLIGDPSLPLEIAPVNPHAPNPTMAQAIPPRAIGDVVPPANLQPAQGVESDAAADARAQQNDQAIEAAGGTAPKRRGN